MRDPQPPHGRQHAAFGSEPGVRVLTIVGASHKPYFDAYLQTMQDVALVDAEAALK